jgi:hypothetical protein
MPLRTGARDAQMARLSWGSRVFDTFAAHPKRSKSAAALTRRRSQSWRCSYTAPLGRPAVPTVAGEYSFAPGRERLWRLRRGAPDGALGGPSLPDKGPARPRALDSVYQRLASAERAKTTHSAAQRRRQIAARSARFGAVLATEGSPNMVTRGLALPAEHRTIRSAAPWQRRAQWAVQIFHRRAGSMRW